MIKAKRKFVVDKRHHVSIYAGHSCFLGLFFQFIRKIKPKVGSWQSVKVFHRLRVNGTLYQWVTNELTISECGKITLNMANILFVMFNFK